ncbi:unnamed protein product, partial [Brassica oleracea]
MMDDLLEEGRDGNDKGMCTDTTKAETVETLNITSSPNLSKTKKNITSSKFASNINQKS